MKTTLLLFVALVAVACAPKSEFDITPAQANQRKMRGGPMDMKNLPKGAVRNEKIYHKGDKLPDGSIADGERKIVTVEENRGP